MKKSLLAICITLLAISQVMAKITLPALFTDGMVLQQKASVNLWGVSTAHKISVKPSWSTKTYTAPVAADGSWKIAISTPVAGGPYSISLNDGTITIIKDVLIGEVWICAGQSNMEMPVVGFKNTPIGNSADILFDADEPKLRLFHVKGANATEPKKDVVATWQTSSAATAGNFSAVGYQFAKMLQQRLHVPVGIIEATVGGTAIQLWTKRSALTTDPAFLKNFDTIKKYNGVSSTLYNGMIAPLVGYTIKGMIWYQGESNITDYESYDRLMEAMVADFRDSWAQGNWGFYYVQIAPCDYRRYKPAIQHILAPYLREAQQRALKLIPNSYMIGSLDVGNEFTIHPPDKLTISKRLAMAAMVNEYGKTGLPYLSPAYKSVALTDTTAMLTFGNTGLGLTSYDKSLTGFEAAGADHIYHPAMARFRGDGIEVKCNTVKKMVSVRYCFKDYAPASVFDINGLPMLPFRTDTDPPGF